VGREILVLVDEVDEEGAIGRSMYSSACSTFTRTTSPGLTRVSPFR
jgi:hypothetical protein